MSATKNQITTFDTRDDGFIRLAEEMALSVLENERQHRYQIIHPLFSFSFGKLVVSLNKLGAKNIALRRPMDSASPVFIIENKARSQTSLNNQIRRALVRLKSFLVVIGNHKRN